MNNNYPNQDAGSRCAIEDVTISQEEKEYNKRLELIQKFQSDWKRYNSEPLFRNIIEAIVRGAEPWDIINQLIDMNAKGAELRVKLLTYGTFPHDFQL